MSNIRERAPLSRNQGIRRTASEVKSLLMRTHGGLLPKTIKVLVHLSESVSEDSPGACTALCLHYPVHAKASSPEEAVVILLQNLVSYLHACELEEAFAPSWAEQVYHIAYEYGTALPIPAVDAKISETLIDYLNGPSSRSLEELIVLRDIRSLQQSTESGIPSVGRRPKSVEAIFGAIAA